jgi:hypothetical protein
MATSQRNIHFTPQAKIESVIAVAVSLIPSDISGRQSE